MEYYSLSKSKSNRHMEPFFINIAPAPANEYEMSSHEGEEFIIVANGEIEINYGNETYVLKKVIAFITTLSCLITYMPITTKQPLFSL